MLSKIQYLVEGHFQRAAGVFNKVGLAPNSVTGVGFLMTLVASLFYSTGFGSVWLVSGAVLLLLVGAYFDAVDGAMARRYHQISKMGGLLDSVEASVFCRPNFRDSEVHSARNAEVLQDSLPGNVCSSSSQFFCQRWLNQGHPASHSLNFVSWSEHSAVRTLDQLASSLASF